MQTIPPSRRSFFLRCASQGFTLIELLVVMVILGLVASVALTTVGSGNQRQELMNEVNRLHAVLRIAAEEAIVSNSEIGVVIEPDLYEFLVFDEKKAQWTNSSQHALRSYSLPEWLTLDFQREGIERKLPGTRSDADGSGLLETKSKSPQLTLFSSGEVDQFIIGLQIEDDTESRVEIKTNEQGEIVLPASDQE